MEKTLPETFSIQDDFEPVSYEQWRALAEESLSGAPFERKLVTRTYDGLVVQPIYSRRDELAGAALGGDDPVGFPGLPPYVRGSQPLGATQTGWDLRQEYETPDLQVANESIRQGLAGGVTSLQLKLDQAACRGLDPDHEAAAELTATGGVMIYSLSELEQALANVPLESVTVALESGAASVPAASLLAGLWRKRGVAAERVQGAFNADPVAALARVGRLPTSAAEALNLMVGLAKWTLANHPQVTAVGVDTSPYHDAGATSAQDVAFATATGVEYLRAMTQGGLSVDEAARQILFRFSLGTHHFQALSKLRAARHVWYRVVEACGGTDPAQAMKIHARTGKRVLTQVDPYVNLLRNSVAVFAAGLGGAEIITSVPFDSLSGLADDFSRRVARNTLFVLQEEAHLQRVVDPAGGSWYLEQLSEQLAQKAWEIFQEIETQGGMLAALRSGWVAEQIDAAYAARAKDIARRKSGITGVSEFPDITAERVVRELPDRAALRAAAAVRMTAQRPAELPDLQAVSSAAEASDKVAACVEAAAAGATLGQLATALAFQPESGESIPALELRTFAAPFEHLRSACDAWLAAHGSRPRVFLANFGPVAHHTGRATWSKNFFEAGGFEVLTNNGFADAAAAAQACKESNAKIAVICSSDKLYSDVVPEAAAKLHEAGAESVVLAGHPGDKEQTWRDAGVDRFIFMKCDVLETLRELLSEQGVIQNGEPTS